MVTDWHGKRVLVTGATGLLGPTLIETLLAQKAEIVALVRETVPSSLFYSNHLFTRCTTEQGDLLDYDQIERIINEQEIEVVFHLGAQAIVSIANRSPRSTFKSNIEGTWNLLEACRHSPWVKKIIIASSDKAYGHQEQLPYTEETPLQGRYPYDVSKSCADLIAQSYYHTYRLPLCITRCGNFFGPGDLHFNRIIPGTLQSLYSGKRPIIRTNGTLIRDYIYVKDVAQGYIMLAEKMDDPSLHGHSFNLSTDKPYTVLEIVQEIIDIVAPGNYTPLVLNQITCEIPAQHLSSEKARTILGWQPHYGLHKGLEETAAWYQAFFAQEQKRNEEYMTPSAYQTDSISQGHCL